MDSLNFHIGAVVEGVDTATQKAASALRELGTAYEQEQEQEKKSKQATEEMKRKRDEERESMKKQRSEIDALKKKRQEEADATKKQAQAQKEAAKMAQEAQDAYNQGLNRTIAIAAGAALAFRAITSAIQDGISAYTAYRSAMSGLESVAEGTGQSMVQLNKITKDLTKDGLVSVPDIVAAEKNLLMYGYTAEQTSDILARLKDSAAYNRQANYSLSEAVKVTTEGIRMENSVLSDAAGVQKNITKMYEEYADQIGKSTQTLTQAEKAQAVYNGIMQETQFQVGNAARYSEEFAGAQARAEASQTRLNTAYGEAVSSGLAPWVSLLSQGTDVLTDFIDNNRVLVSILTTAALGLTAVGVSAGATALLIKVLGLESVVAAGEVSVFSVAMNTLAASFATAWSAMGPIGWIIVGITALVAVVSAVATASEEAKKKTEELRAEIEKLSEDNRGASALIDEYEQLSRKTNKTADDTQRMLDIRAELVETYGYSVSAVDSEGRLLAGNLEIMKEQLETQKKMLLADFEKNSANDAKAYNDALNQRSGLMSKIAEYEGYIAEGKTGETRGSDLTGLHWFDFQEYLDELYAELDAGKEETDAAISNMIQSMVLVVESEGKDVPDAVQQKIVDAINQALTDGLDYDAAQAAGQGLLDAYLTIDDATAQTSIEAVQALRDEMISAFTSEGVDTSAASQLINSLLATITDSGTLEEAYDRAALLKQKIMDGLANPDEMKEYDQLRAEITQGIGVALTEAYNEMAKGTAGAEDVKNALEDMMDGYNKAASEIEKEAMAQEAANLTLKDAASSLRSVASAYESVNKEIQDVANLKAAVNAIEVYTSATDTSAQAAQNAADAREWLAKQYDVEASAIDSMLPSIGDDIALKEALALADYAVGLQAALSAQAQISAMITAGTVTAEQGQKMINALQGVIDKMTELGGKSVTISGIDGKTTSIAAAVTVPRVTTTTKKSSGGSSASKNTALEREMALIEHKKALDQLTTQEEINNLQRVLNKYAKTTDEKNELTEKIYSLKKKKAEEDLDFQKSMDQLTLREEIATYDQMLANFKANTEARREIEVKRYEAQRELEKQEYDLKVYYGQLTLEQQADALQRMISTYKAGTDARIDLEKQLYDVQKSIKERDLDNLNNLIDATQDALEARYNEQRDKEDERLKASSDAWQKWGDDQVAAIQKQIDALDDQSEADDRAEQERKKRREIAMLEQAALYETDAYNRKKLEEQIAQKKTELDKWLADNQRADLKKSLQDQQDAVKETVENEKKKIQDQIDANDDYYDELTKAENLKNEAIKLLMSGGQNAIVDLLKSYAPEYDATGQTLGEKLYDGFMSKVGAIGTWFDGLVAKFNSFKADLASVASSAAVNYRVATDTQNTTATASAASTTPQVIMQFYTPVTSPTELRREGERMADLLAKL